MKGDGIMPRSMIGPDGEILLCHACGKLSVRFPAKGDVSRRYLKGCDCEELLEIMGWVPEGCLVAVGEEEIT